MESSSRGGGEKELQEFLMFGWKAEPTRFADGLHETHEQNRRESDSQVLDMNDQPLMSFLLPENCTVVVPVHGCM